MGDDEDEELILMKILAARAEMFPGQLETEPPSSTGTMINQTITNAVSRQPPKPSMLDQPNSPSEEFGIMKAVAARAENEVIEPNVDPEVPQPPSGVHEIDCEAPRGKGSLPRGARAPGAYSGAPGESFRRLENVQYDQVLCSSERAHDDHVAVVSPSNTQDPEENQVALTKMEQEKPRWKKFVVGLGLVGALALILLLVFLLPGESTEPESQNIEESQDPAEEAINDSILRLFPNDTLQALEVSNSPQANAYQWLVEDPSFIQGLYSDARIRQRFGLATFYYATGGPKSWLWKPKNWMEYSEHECDWLNLQCSQRDRELYAMEVPEHPRMYGTLPNELFWLTNLVYLGFWGSKTLGTLPTQLSRMTLLEILELGNNRLEGFIPSELGLLTNLAALDLSDNRLTGQIPSELGLLTPLTGLDLGDNELTGSIPSELGLLTALIGLTLHSNQLTGLIPTELGLITSLSSFQLNKNQLTGPIPSELGLITALTKLTLPYNQITGTVPATVCSQRGSGLQKLSSLVVDCVIECNCCDDHSYCGVTNPPATLNLRPTEKHCPCWPGGFETTPALVDSLGDSDCIPHSKYNDNGTGTENVDEWRVTCSDGTWVVATIERNGAATFPTCNFFTSGRFTDMSVFRELKDREAWLGCEWDVAETGRASGFNIFGGVTSTAPDSKPEPTSEPLALVVAPVLEECGGLPSFTLEALGDSSSPQFEGYQWLLQHPDFDSMECGRLTQLFALATFYHATKPSGLDALNWLRYNVNECDWGSPWHSGAQCNNGEYTALGTYDTGLEGSLPAELSLLTQLKLLYLERNRMRSSLPTELGLLTALQGLNLARNFFTGAIPTELAQLTQLEYMWLDRNSLTGQLPTELGALTAITTLLITDNSLFEGSIPTELGQATLLNRLSLLGNGLQGSLPSQLGLLTSLTRLTLRNNDMSDSIPTEYGQLTQLDTLWIHSNRLTGKIPSELGLLTMITNFYLSNNNLSGSLPQELANLSQLEHLALYSNDGLTGTIPSNLCSLTTWEPDGLKVTCTSVECPCGDGICMCLL